MKHESNSLSKRDEEMATIVEYTDATPPLNMYPDRIISPTGGKACCARNMEQIGGVEREGERSYFYRRCHVCGYTVRHFLATAPPDRPSGHWDDELSYLLKLVA